MLGSFINLDIYFLDSFCRNGSVGSFGDKQRELSAARCVAFISGLKCKDPGMLLHFKNRAS